MKAKLRKYLLPFLMIILAGSVELVGVLLCGKMIPDYKNELFTEEKRNITQLMFIDEEENSRFYPWLSYDESDCVTVDEYLKRLYTSDYVMKTVTGVSENDEMKGVYKDIDIEALKQELCSSEIEDFNNMVIFIIYVFDGENAVDQETDFSKEIMIDENKNMIYLKDFECSDSNGEKKLLDLVMTLGNKDVLYYRFRSKDTKKATATEINQKSKELTEDVQYVMENFSKYFSEDEITTEVNGYYDEEQKEIEDKIEENSVSEADKNIITDYFSGFYSGYPIESFDVYYQDEMICCSFGSDGWNPYPIIVSFPQYLDELQYSIFSYDDELMIVFSDNNTSFEISNIILYYSMSDERITGFSMSGGF